jgi:cyclic pyranopterin phosphate synthase
MKKLTHLDSKGRARMVDISAKPHSLRQATATCAVIMKRKTLDLIKKGGIPKGDVLSVARVAGIMASKKTPELIPLCHPIPITSVSVDLKPVSSKNRMKISATVTTVGQTGAEMEALTAVSAAALAVYDMCKAVDREMSITDIVLEEKKGGSSGHFKRKRQPLAKT